eukprot:TRINITY_DN612_c1_g2_i1.p1 TRINITY_DN612_c1_g2~~TRINITY_DN612_c1_g2_i1.p1  ORF type:complete len:1627 (+),score=444.93 TRINITY_DN612_c1_g2_i1:115-4995(+)
MTSLAVIVTAWVLARRCTTNPDICNYKVDFTFAEAYRIRYGLGIRDGDYKTILGNPDFREAICDADMWRKRSEACGGCAHEFVVTRGLPERFLNRPLCLSEVEMLPHTDMSHLTPEHPSHNKEMEVVTTNSTWWGQDGCRGNWPQESLEGKIAIVPSCSWNGWETMLPEPFRKGVGAFIRFIQTTSLLKEENENRPPFDVHKDGFHNVTAFNGYSFPAFNIQGEILKANRAGTRVYGRVVSNCDKSFDVDSSTVDTSSYGGDTCPGWKMTHKDLCSTMPQESNRLCATCPLMLRDVKTGNDISCLYAPDLVPTRKTHLLRESLSFPLREKIIYFEMNSIQSNCDPNRFNSSWADRIVMFGMGHVHGCPRSDALLAAQVTGVRGVINVIPDRIRGSSYGLTVPSASTSNPVDMVALATFMKASAEQFSGSGYRSWEVEVELYIPEHINLTATPAPPLPEGLPVAQPDEDKLIEQPGVIAGIVIIPVVLILIIAKMVYTRKTSVPLPGGTSGVSLSTGSTALSMAMAMLLTCITFGLTLNAGQRGVSKASDSGNTVARLATEMNTRNVKALTDGTVVQMLSTAREAFRSMLIRKRDTGMESVIYRNKDRGEWGWRSSISSINSLFTVKEDPTVSGSITKTWGVYMREGGYLDSDGNSNYRYNFDVNVGSSNRELYDILKHMWYSEIPKGESSTGMWLVNTYQADLDVDGRFEFSEYQLPSPWWRGNYGPFLSYVKAFNTGGLPLGHYVVSEPFFHYSYAVQQSLESHVSRNPIAENMTFCFYREDGVIFAMTPGIDDLYQSVDFFGPSLASGWGVPDVDPARSSHNTVGYKLTSIFNTRQVHFNAMGYRFLEQFGTIVAKKNIEGGTTAVTQTFDQKDYARMTSSVLLHVRADHSLKDVSGNAWDVTVTCWEVNSTACFTYGTGRFGASLKLDGTGSFTVLPYLTQRTPRVAATRVPGVTWNSTKLVYNSTTSHDGIDDVITTWANNDGSQRRPVVRDRFHLMQQHSISLWVNPSVSVTDHTNSSLFVDTDNQKTASYRLTSDAQLLIHADMYGCMTSPVKGGLPVGQWTFITVSVNYARNNRFCAVYINGALHSRNTVSYKIDMPYSLDPYRLGVNFNGELDDVQFHNRSLSADDAKSMFETGDLSPIQSKTYSTVAIGIDLHKPAGFPAMVYSLAVPNEDIVREAQAVADALMANLRVEQDNTNKQLDRNSIETLFIIATVLLLSALLFITFNHMLTKPFAAFAVEIDAVAQIDVDGMEPSTRTSMLLEINVMSKAMNTLVRNMKEFKSFMPLSMQECVQGEESKSDKGDSDQKSVARSRTSSRTGGSRHGSHRAESLQRTMTSDDSFALRSVYHNRAKFATELLVATLSKRKMSFLVVNVKGFLRSMSGSSEREVIQGHQSYIQHCIDSSQQRNGMPETFSGDRVLISFNGVKTCSSHSEAAADTSLLIRDKWPEGFAEGVNMSLAVGSVRAGNIGAQAMRRYTMLGSSVTWVHALERFGCVNGKQIVSDGQFSDQVKGRYEFRHFAALSCPKYSSRTVLVTSFMKAVRCVDDEWMYQLENAAKQSENGLWNTLFEHVVKGRWEDARQALEKRDDMHITESDCFGELETALDSKSFTPTDVKYLC